MKHLRGMLMALALSLTGPVYAAECPMQSVQEIYAVSKQYSVNVQEFHGAAFKAVWHEVEYVTSAPEEMVAAADGLLVLTDSGTSAMLILTEKDCALGAARFPKDVITVILNAVLKEADDGRSQPKL